jgi:Fur family transcriptional regulator, ferric uptake regulator
LQFRYCIYTHRVIPVEGLDEPWRSLPVLLRQRGLRWTPQRAVVVGVLAASDGHLTGAELVERCRAADPRTIPSTVYRTLDALEEMGLVQHGHGADGREEYHVRPDATHGHRYCAACGHHWDIEPESAAGQAIAGAFADEGFEVDLSHVTVVGRCASCLAQAGR